MRAATRCFLLLDLYPKAFRRVNAGLRIWNSVLIQLAQICLKAVPALIRSS